ncbi:hypothetical protein KCP91_08760 [Microvirga sp. SRT01]|uniref:Guanylate cyclase domain-containing protein n=1 Tax=Sphingomonas longa TaxID=2778730 RepID=A0ABS2D6E6_9SPHN|nr:MULTISPECIES: hypothetical protein [Alphaproteobacteria]MBM6576463.1 hypothetical protein [Sphingomonas sp. BT552]MBR7709509.1 hypothetical protein [Microvirga sp. SRT01]
MIGLSFVAFVDILGFGEMVVADYENAAPGTTYLPSLKAAIHTALASATSINSKITQFSDSIVVSSPFSTSCEEFEQHLRLVRDLQSLLFNAGILCRGGISHGRHFHDETLLFSQGLIDAYRLKSQVATDPRIVVSGETLDLLYPTGAKLDFLIRDVDNEAFLDYLGHLDGNHVSGILEKFRPSLTKSSPRVRSKTAWLYRYANFCHEEIMLPELITMRRSNNT